MSSENINNNSQRKKNSWSRIQNQNLNVRNHVPLSSEQAHEKLKRKLNKSGINEDLRPVPKGRAVFMLGYTKGKTRPLVTLYDTGCGAVLFRGGIAQKELAPALLRQKGPYLVNGVGDTLVKVNSEWRCSTSLVDGTRQELEGWSVDKITATFPLIN